VYFNLEVTFYHPEKWNFKTRYYGVGSHILIFGEALHLLEDSGF
jgi:hypothetical protein